MYRLEIDSAPAYELALSMMTYHSRQDHKLLDAGPQWAREVREHISPDTHARLMAMGPFCDHDPLDLLIWQCPGARDACAFLQWFGGLSVGELYDLVAPYLLAGSPALKDLAAVQGRNVPVLSAWYEQYFRHVDPAILEGLSADAAEKKALQGTMDPVDLAEAATCGVRLEPVTGLDTVLLVPQYHFRPLNAQSKYEGMRVCLYPVDVVPPPPGAPPANLLRLTRALSDESRLRILRFLADGPHSFTEIVRHTGLAKSTVHHHMLALRSAGLARLHDLGAGGATYSLRGAVLDEVDKQLGDFIAGG